MLSNYLEDALLKHLLGIAEYTPASAIKLALSKTNPTETGAGITEPVGGGYSRTTITFDSANNGIIRNNNLIEFPTATNNWGDIRYVAFFDNNSNFLGYNPITPIEVNSGDVLSFPVGGIQIEFNLDYMSKYLANKLLNHVFKNTSYAQPSLYLALSKTLIVDTIEEPSISAGYNRIAVTNTDFSVTNGVAISTRNFTFGVATDDWGHIYGTSIMDDEDGGNVLLFFNFETPINAVLGTSIIFDESNYVITLN